MEEDERKMRKKRRTPPSLHKEIGMEIKRGKERGGKIREKNGKEIREKKRLVKGKTQ